MKPKDIDFVLHTTFYIQGNKAKEENMSSNCDPSYFLACLALCALAFANIGSATVARPVSP